MARIKTDAPTELRRFLPKSLLRAMKRADAIIADAGQPAELHLKSIHALSTASGAAMRFLEFDAEQERYGGGEAEQQEKTRLFIKHMIESTGGGIIALPKEP